MHHQWQAIQRLVLLGQGLACLQGTLTHTRARHNSMATQGRAMRFGWVSKSGWVAHGYLRGYRAIVGKAVNCLRHPDALRIGVLSFVRR